ncbi:MAG: cupin domain-containing protein [Anaerolineae bacterium]
MQTAVITPLEKLTQFSDHWSPKIIAQLNDYHLKLAKIEGEFVWHSHPETDELFMVLAGEMWIELRDGRLHLQTGDLTVIPKGVEHKPVAEKECHILLIEPAGTVNTGNVHDEMTAENDQWI